MKGKWMKLTLAILACLILILGGVLIVTIHRFNQKSMELRWHTIQHMQRADYYMKQYQTTHNQNDLNQTSRELAKASEVIFDYAYIYKPELEDLSITQLDVLADEAADPNQANNVKHDLDLIMKYTKINVGKNQLKLGTDRPYFETTLLKVSHALPNPLH